MQTKGSRGARALGKRLQKLRARGSRIRGLRSSRKGTFRVARSGGLASATRGRRARGMATTRLAQLRSAFGQALFGAPKGRCRALEFLLSVGPKADPRCDAHVFP
eukprot:190559-Pyramimonas_sp.AAC.2